MERVLRCVSAWSFHLAFVVVGYVVVVVGSLAVVLVALDAAEDLVGRALHDDAAFLHEDDSMALAQSADAVLRQQRKCDDETRRRKKGPGRLSPRRGGWCGRGRAGRGSGGACSRRRRRGRCSARRAPGRASGAARPAPRPAAAAGRRSNCNSRATLRCLRVPKRHAQSNRFAKRREKRESPRPMGRSVSCRPT